MLHLAEDTLTGRKVRDGRMGGSTAQPVFKRRKRDSEDETIDPRRPGCRLPRDGDEMRSLPDVSVVESYRG